jgi:hypothetical protein
MTWMRAGRSATNSWEVHMLRGHSGVTVAITSTTHGYYQQPRQQCETQSAIVKADYMDAQHVHGPTLKDFWHVRKTQPCGHCFQKVSHERGTSSFQYTDWTAHLSSASTFVVPATPLDPRNQPYRRNKSGATTLALCRELEASGSVGHRAVQTK